MNQGRWGYSVAWRKPSNHLFRNEPHLQFELKLSCARYEIQQIKFKFNIMRCTWNGRRYGMQITKCHAQILVT